VGYVGSLFKEDYLGGIWLALMVDPECLCYWREKKSVLAKRQENYHGRLQNVRSHTGEP